MPATEMDDTIDALGLHFKRKYEAECQESLTLAMALRDATTKNAQLVAIAEQLQSEIKRLKGDDGTAADGEIIPPTKPGGSKAAKAVN